MRVTGLRTVIDNEGRVSTAVGVDGLSVVFLPYRAENACLHDREGASFAELLPVVVAPQQACPYCGALLHLTATEAYCCNLGCAPRRAAVLLQQLALLGVPVGAALANQIYTDPGLTVAYFLTEPALVHPEAAQVRRRLTTLRPSEYLRLLGVPECYAEQMDDLQAPLYAPANLWTSLVTGNLLVEPDATHTQAFLRAAMLAVCHVNRDLGWRLASIQAPALV